MIDPERTGPRRFDDRGSVRHLRAGELGTKAVWIRLAPQRRRQLTWKYMIFSTTCSGLPTRTGPSAIAWSMSRCGVALPARPIDKMLNSL